HDDWQGIVRIGELIANGVVVGFDQRTLLAIRSKIGRRRRYESFMLIHSLNPEDKTVRREGMTIAPFHTTAQMKGDRPASIADRPTFGNIGAHVRARIVKIGQMVAFIDPLTGGRICWPGEAAAPRPTIRADSMQGFNDDRVLPNALRHRGELTSLDEVCQLRSLLKAGGELRGVSDNLWPLEFPYERGLLAACYRRLRRGHSYHPISC